MKLSLESVPSLNHVSAFEPDGLELGDPPVHRALDESAGDRPMPVAPGAFVVLSLRGSRVDDGLWGPYDLPPGIALVGVSAPYPDGRGPNGTEQRVELLVARDLPADDYLVVMAYRTGGRRTPARSLRFVLSVRAT